MAERRETRTNKRLCECPAPPPPNPVYECPSPLPVVVECKVCCMAENPGCNLWSCLPFMSHSSLLGPTWGDVIIQALNLLPLSAISWLGIGHPKTCDRSEDPVTCNESGNAVKPARKRNQKICPPAEPCGDNRHDDVAAEMNREVNNLVRRLAEFRPLTSYDENGDRGDGEDTRFLDQARHYVLDRLAEMLSKREEYEERMKKRH